MCLETETRSMASVVVKGRDDCTILSIRLFSQPKPQMYLPSSSLGYQQYTFSLVLIIDIFKYPRTFFKQTNF